MWPQPLSICELPNQVKPDCLAPGLTLPVSYGTCYGVTFWVARDWARIQICHHRRNWGLAGSVEPKVLGVSAACTPTRTSHPSKSVWLTLICKFQDRPGWPVLLCQSEHQSESTVGNLCIWKAWICCRNMLWGKWRRII